MIISQFIIKSKSHAGKTGFSSLNNQFTILIYLPFSSSQVFFKNSPIMMHGLSLLKIGCTHFDSRSHGKFSFPDGRLQGITVTSQKVLKHAETHRELRHTSSS